MTLGDEAFGSIRIGVSTLLMRQELNASLRPALLTAAIALAVAVFVAALLAQLLLRPIHVIRSGLTRLGKGEFGVTVDLPPGDEFGELGEFFNTVSQQLSADRMQLAGQDLKLQSAVERAMAYSRKLVALGRLTAGIAHEVKNPLNAMMIHLELLRTKIRNGALAVEPRPATRGGVRIGHRPGRGRARARAVAGRAGRAGARRDHRKRNPPARRGGPGVPEVHAARGAAAQSGEHGRLVRGDHAGGRAGGAGEQREGVGRRARRRFPPSTATPRCCARRFSISRSTAARRCRTAGRCGSSARPPPSDRVEVRVEDTGVGIPPEHLEKIFDLYFTTKDHGTGIGLSMVYRIIQMHDGELEVQSTPGSGTTFAFFCHARMNSRLWSLAAGLAIAARARTAARKLELRTEPEGPPLTGACAARAGACAG